MSQTAAAPSVVGTAQAGERLGLTSRTVLRFINAGLLPATKTGPGTAGFVIAVEDLERFAAERAQA